MHLVIDLQGAQSESRNRGIGRYSRELAMAMAAQPRAHTVSLLLNGSFPDATEALRDSFSPWLPASAIHVWHGPGRQTAMAPADHPRRRAAEHIRAAVLAGLRPDLLLMASTFEGFGDDAVTMLPASAMPPPTVGICYDLIPLSRPDVYLASPLQQAWYYPRLLALSNYDALLCISQSCVAEVQEHLKMPAVDLTNIQAGVSARFRPATHDKSLEPVLARYRLQPGYILCLGAAEERKNLTALISAYALLPKPMRARHPLVLTCWNDIHQQVTLRKMIAQAGLDEAEVRLLTEFVPDGDVPALYHGCGVSVCPSLHEGFGLSVAEAMACGVPVLCSNVSSLPEVMDHPASLFDPRNPSAIADRLRAVLESPVLANELAQYGLARAARFTWPQTASRSWDALEAVAARPATTSPQRKPTLGVVTPVAGAQDWLRRFLPLLARWYDITLLTDDAPPSSPLLNACFSVRPIASLASQTPDRLLYRPGDDSSHAALTLQQLEAYPGVVLAGTRPLAELLAQGAAEAADVLQDAMLNEYGWQAAIALREDPAALARYPLDGLLAGRALGVVADPEADADTIHAAIMSAYAGPRAAFERCLASLAGDESTALPDVAKALAATFQRPRSHSVLMLDVTTIAQFDAGTGIQRVVREVTHQFGCMPDLRARVEPVYLAETITLARPFGRRLFALPALDEPAIPVRPGPGDIFIGLDLHIHDVGRLSETIRAVRAAGGRAIMVIYDLLPILMPKNFPAPVQEMFPQWLSMISQKADGLVCISRTVADELLAWLERHPPERTRPLQVGWFHLGADFRQVVSGAAESTGQAVHASKTRPTALVIGTLEPRKGHSDVLGAFDLLWAEGLDVGVTFVGRTGWLMQALEDRILAHPELGHRLHWVRDADDAFVATLYRCSGALLSASEGEGFGLPLVEGAQAGLPVIARDLPIFREVCGENAFYFSGGPEPLSAAVRHWLRARAEQTLPDAAGITTISWRESSRRLAEIVLDEDWYATWYPKDSG